MFHLRRDVAEAWTRDRLPVRPQVRLLVRDHFVAALVREVRCIWLHKLHGLLQVGAHLKRTRPEPQPEPQPVSNSVIGQIGLDETENTLISPAKVVVVRGNQKHDVP